LGSDRDVDQMDAYSKDETADCQLFYPVNSKSCSATLALTETGSRRPILSLKMQQFVGILFPILSAVS